MAYTYAAGVQITDSSGRFLNLTQTPTLQAYNFRTGVALTGTPTITNIRTGVYRVEVSDDNLIDVVFAIVPHADDQAAVDDIAVMEVKTYHEVAEILTDTGTTLPASLSTIQTDLDNPNQYKADVSALALEATLDAIKGTGWTDEDLVAIKAAIDEIIIAWTAADISASMTEGIITQIRGNSWDIDITGLTLDSNKQQFAIKETKLDADAQALLLIDTATGLLYVNGAAAPDATKASLSYVGTTLTVTVDASITAQLPTGSFRYGIQSVTAAGVVSESYGGTFTITADTVRATA